MSEPYPSGPAGGPKVLYVGGTGRTGSTLLTRLLGQVPGWFAGGELAFLWRFGLTERGRCSCGAPVRSCPVWGATLEAVAAAGRPVDPDRMVALRRRCWSAHLPLLAHGPTARRRLDRLEEFPDVVERTYRALAATTGSRVIVDSSKEPHYSWILRERTDLDVRFLHLVRDPRAVGLSWRRRRREAGFAGDTDMETRGAVEMSTYYDVSNIAAERIWRGDADRYRFMRYEDFVQRPAAALDAVFAFMGEPAPATPVLDGHTFHASAGHMAWGNPNRFDAGDIVIRPDDGWRSQLPAGARRTIAVATAPVARRYGYRLTRTHAPVTDPVAGLARAMIPSATRAGDRRRGRSDTAAGQD